MMSSPVQCPQTYFDPRNGGRNRLRPVAFTLVELLVVIGIIGILVALVVTVVAKVKKNVYAAQTSAQLSAISGAIQQYYAEFKAYPGPIPNNQLGAAYDPGTPIYPYVGSASNPVRLVAINPNSNTNITLSTAQLGHITGAQNLVLGLLGGLEYNAVNYPSTPFYYNPQDIFPDGKTPGPVGASSLNPNNPRRQQAFMQVKPGDISLPSMSYNGGKGASFADSAGRSPSDAPIPVFLDKYPDPLPIIYMRTNPGGKAIVGVRNTDGKGGPLIDDGPYGDQVNSETPQYDLCQLFDYVLKNSSNPNGVPFGVILTSNTPYHGLQGIGDKKIAPSGPIDVIGSDKIKTYGSDVNGYANSGLNGIAYFRDPSMVASMNMNNGAGSSYDPLASNTHNGVPRQKDGYLLISAGADRAYGTSDDIVFPGKLLP